MPLHQVLIYETAILSQLHYFWDTIQDNLAQKVFYILSIGAKRMRLPKIQDNDKKARQLKSEGLPKAWKNIEKVFHYSDLLYVL